MKGSQWNKPEDTPWSPTELLFQLPLQLSLQAGMRVASQNLYAPSKRHKIVSCYQPQTVRSGLLRRDRDVWTSWQLLECFCCSDHPSPSLTMHGGPGEYHTVAQVSIPHLLSKPHGEVGITAPFMGEEMETASPMCLQWE